MGKIFQLQEIFDTRNNFIGGPQSRSSSLNVLNGRHHPFDYFKWPSLSVWYAYMSMCAINKF